MVAAVVVVANVEIYWIMIVVAVAVVVEIYMG